jgi:excisionase family DNA binding protein
LDEVAKIKKQEGGNAMRQRFLKVEEASERLGIEVGTLYHWKCQGKVPYTKIGGKLLFRESDIDKFIEDNTVMVNKPDLI